jgi:hypothetical protein
MTDEQGGALNEAHPNQRVRVKTSLPVSIHDLLRRKK